MTYHVDLYVDVGVDELQVKRTVQSASDYFPYGKALRSYGKERYQSTYHERDLESGFDYRGARFYDADVARFNSLDPNASDYASWSDYSYVLCNPVNLIDPDGKDPVDPPKKVGLGRRIAGLAVDFSPLGLGKGFVEVFTGKDLVTGEKLSYGERALGALPGGKFFKAAGTVIVIVKTGDKVADGAKAGAKAADGQKTYETYTKTNSKTGEVYSGRTSGTKSPLENVQARDKNHHMNDKGFGPAKLDKSSTNKDAIRGREQQNMDANGGAKSQGGTSGNAINGIGPKNKKKDQYMDAAKKEFGGD